MSTDNNFALFVLFSDAAELLDRVFAGLLFFSKRTTTNN
jgi:hypothetical protein